MRNTPKVPLALLAGCALLLQSCAPVVIGGTAGAAVVANDRRSAGAFVEDQVIEAKGALGVSESIGDSVDVGITSFNRIVLLTGQAPTRELRNKVQETVEGIPNIRQIHNRVQIANPASMTQSLADSSITSRVKLALLGSQETGFSGLDIKVVSELGVVYLMGIVTPEQAANAVRITRNVSGVLNVVRLFEYSE